MASARQDRAQGGKETETEDVDAAVARSMEVCRDEEDCAMVLERRVVVSKREDGPKCPRDKLLSLYGEWETWVSIETKALSW